MRIEVVAADRRNPAGPTIPTTEQLAWAARVAWANADRGIGRLRWRGLQVRDLRGVTDPDAVASGLAEHLRVATRDGRIRSVATVLDPGVEILNDQLVGYAGYRQADGTILGDPRHLELTTLALRAGWPGGRPVDGGRLLPGPFDVLPLLLRVHDGPVIAYELSPERVLEVNLEHPGYAWFAELGLRWYAVPALSRHRLHFTETLAYPVAFSGFYVAFEMACRELADQNRYNALPMIARCLGPEGGVSRQDAARVLHQAILHSFGRAGMVPPTASARLEIYHRYLPRRKAGPRPVYRPIDAPVPSGATPITADPRFARHRLEAAV
ncbi:nitric oxide synthase oxygenase [Cryptosporangium minutisporangium]|uniref:Nitric oxide synthase oxygenase n=1 Tax=Cryptosporangium minutisporangium TaxID=113569 RepID=A0ABP6TA59_9ACTN